MAAAAADGRITMKLLDSNNQSFIENPFYTNYNFLQDDQTSAQSKAEAMSTALTDFVTGLTSNTVESISVTYEVAIS